MLPKPLKSCLNCQIRSHWFSIQQQCDQLLEFKVSKCSNSYPKRRQSSFYLNLLSYFKIAPKVTKYFGLFWIKICQRQFLKIAQSGHFDSMSSKSIQRWQQNFADWRLKKEISFRSLKMISDVQLAIFSNFVGILLFLLVVLYHFIAANNSK